MGQCLTGVGCVVLGEGMVRVRGVALSAGGREEISRGLAAGLSGRAIGRLLVMSRGRDREDTAVVMVDELMIAAEEGRRDSGKSCRCPG